jgi:hypothetical protein
MAEIKQRLMDISANCRAKGMTHAENAILDGLDYIRLLELIIIRTDALNKIKDESSEDILTLPHLCKLIKGYNEKAK